MKSRHQIEGNIVLKLKFRVLGRIGVIEIDVPPEVLFEQQRRLQDVIDDGIDKFLVQDAMANMPTEGNG